MRYVLPLAAGLVAALGLFWFAAEHAPQRGTDATRAAVEATPRTVAEAAAASDRLVPELLLRIYEGFSRTEEAAIYDTLAQAAHGKALESLYLARAGAMADGGLSGTDQTVHEMRMTRIVPRADGETLRVDAEWHVIGTVGHGEHVHVRGNTYRAELAIAKVDGAWRLTGFTLLDVDRSGAGELLETH